ncbi:MAG: aminopeptidase P family protein [Planctomycetota bacterium]|nr:MAG: aminopeptidase P family protein [Planctomycetota bacterium]
MRNLDSARKYMLENGIDCWLVYDFRGSNPVLAQLLEAGVATSRRSFLVIPAKGEPVILTHVIESTSYPDMPVEIEYYVSWEELKEKLGEKLKGCKKVAMEYFPEGMIPTMSIVDGGTLELVRSLGVEVVTSADLFQLAAATWDETGLKSHLSAADIVTKVIGRAFSFIGETLREGKNLTEYDVQMFIRDRLVNRGFEPPGHPIVAVNENSGNPHYFPTEEKHSPITAGDWVLIDMWGRLKGEQTIAADITWVGYAGKDIPQKMQEIFDIVVDARNLVVERLKQAWSSGEKLKGYMLDDVARERIRGAGYGEYFTHRTGHNIGPGDFSHGLGVNLDNLETHDAREILPDIGFSVEPGIYLPEFGVRSEIDVFMSPDGPLVTTSPQKEIIKIL